MKAVILNSAAESAIVEQAREYGIPIMTFDALVTLGRHAVRVFAGANAKRMSFDEMCETICKFLETPWGFKILKEILSKDN